MPSAALGEFIRLAAGSARHAPSTRSLVAVA
jgi:hypothetical protein